MKDQITPNMIIRQQLTTRGGGIEIDLSHFGIEGKMAAYQNYLGGGMLGKVLVNDTINASTPFVEEELAKKLYTIGQMLVRYYIYTQYHHFTGDRLTREDLDARMRNNNTMPVSAY